MVSVFTILLKYHGELTGVTIMVCHIKGIESRRDADMAVSIAVLVGAGPANRSQRVHGICCSRDVDTRVMSPSKLPQT